MTIQFSSDDVRRFAEWSADRNPLHVDETLARQTHFGQRVVHGVLTVLESLRVVGDLGRLKPAPTSARLAEAAGEGGGRVRALDIEFRSAVTLDTPYVLERHREGDEAMVTLHHDGQAVLSVRVDLGVVDAGPSGDVDTAGGDRSWMHAAAGQLVRSTPAARTVGELSAGVTVTGAYAWHAVPGDPVAASTGLTQTQTRVLALCSYVTGMEVPGLKSLFTRITLRFHGDADGSDLRYRARTLRFDRQFRMLDTELDVVSSSGLVVATGLLRSYVPFSPVEIDLEAIARHLVPETQRLQGAVALVVGGSRGLGADLSATLARAGCHVYASARHADHGARELQQRLSARGARMELLQGDAGDAGWCASVRDEILARHGRLDLLVLNACAPPAFLRVGPDSASRREEYVRENLRLVEAPLAACVASLAGSAGTVLYVSSSFVEDTPPGFGHYVAVKQAAEGLVRTTVREWPQLRALVVRPPVLQTRWNDTPAGVLGAIPSSVAAIHAVNHAAFGTAGACDLLTEFPAFEAEPPTEPPADPYVRLAASFTTDPLVPALDAWLKELGIPGTSAAAPYNQVLQSLLDPGSVLHTRGPGCGVVMVRVGDWLRELPDEQAGDIELVRGHLQAMSHDLDRAVRAHRAQASSETLLIVCPSHGARSSAESILVRQTETGLAARLSGVSGLQVVVAQDFHAHYAVDEDQVHDPLRDDIAHIPYRDDYFHVLAAVVVRHLHRRLTPVRKVVVVDCDNTLWSGVVGEVGAEGISFDEGHHALHAMLQRLTARGMLVCLCSKNEEADVWRVFETRDDLRLRREHVVAAAVNWLPKSQNIRMLAGRLNLGLDSFVFLDDNPVECADVRAGCPEVLTLQWPHEPARAIRLLQHIWELDAGRTTKEDARRTELYREELRRQELRAETLTFEDFIESLQLQVDFSPLGPDDLRRAAQLTLRTNQFNFTTIRREEADLQVLLSGGRHEIRTIRVRDRFGDYGLVGLFIAERGAEAWTLDTFLLSCRVLGRGVEHRIVADLGQMAAAAGASRVHLRLETTNRNTPARSFLESVVPETLRRGDARGIECDVPADVLAAVRFEPSAGEVVVQEEGGATSAPAAPLDAASIRWREAQIARAAFELSTGAGMRAAFEGRPAPAADAASGTGASDVASIVHAAFARALRMTPARVAEVDRLEALGCDSLRIVEITVALSETFPSMPGTMLFEHRSVSRIVEAIAALFAGSPATRAHSASPASAPLEPARAARAALEEGIAVVGLHVRCAGADSPEALWTLLSSGQSAVRPVPRDRRHFLQPLADGRPHWAGLLDEPGRFDADLFGVSPREAEYMDPQLRLFLEVAWSALEDAGCAGAGHEPETGVFAGVMYGDYGFRANRASAATDNPYRSWEGFSLANRLSHLLGFHGPSLAVDTACSSSGTALHLACAALRRGECRAAVVGGVNLILDPDRFGSLGRLGILSARGRCEPFGADADGTVLGEGAGVVVLRPLSDAMRRGDRIYGVIKGTGLSTGSGTVGFTAPNPQSQAEAIRRTVAAAGVDPRTISYVETHGTGTSLGDPIEVRGLTLAYGDASLQDPSLSVTPRCTIGSIKPNIGHLEAGAGVLGLIKVLLQIQHGQLLPSITSPRPNPQIPFGDGPFDVQHELQEWRAPVAHVNGVPVTLPRRAGLSSFGVGGANAHVIVEELNERQESGVRSQESEGRGQEAEPVERPLHLLALSAPTRASLDRQVQRLREHLTRHPDEAIADLAWTVNTGRRSFAHRRALLARDSADLLRVLAGAPEATPIAAAAPKVAFLFTGQGSQYARMGQQLHATQPVFREALERCAARIDQHLDRRLLDLLAAPEGSADAALLNQTGYTQPALFAFQYALAALWRSWGVEPAVVMGHSVGEIAAMCVAGGVSLEDGVTLIAARGRLMQALPAGGVMTSVMADETRVLEAIAGSEADVAIAAINAPGQVVISGAGVAVAEIEARLTAEGIKTKSLTVSHAFHSPLMKPMLAEYERVVRRIRFVAPRVPIVSCVDGVLAGAGMAQPEYWLRQVLEPVRFASGVATLAREQVSAYVEVGPHPVLLAMARQCVEDDGPSAWLPSVRRDADEWRTLLGSLGTLYARGTDIDWAGFDAPYARRRVAAPTYAFGGDEYWIRGADDTRGPGSAVDGIEPYDRRPGAAGRDPAADPADRRIRTQTDDVRNPPYARRYDLVWRKVEAASGAEQDPAPYAWTILADRSGVGAELARLLRARGATATLVTSDTSLETLTLPPAAFRLVDLRGLDGREPRDVDAVVWGAVRAAQMAARAGASGPALWIVTQGVHSRALFQAPLWGLGRTLALEHPEVWGGLIDVPPGDPRLAAGALVRELLQGEGVEDQVALTAAGRYVPRLVPGESASSRRTPARYSASAEGTYLVTGGTGALGLHAARWLASHGAQHIVLAGRRGAADESARDGIARLEASGVRVSAMAADVSRAEDVDALLARIASAGPPLRGVVHAAGVDAPTPVVHMTADDVQSALAAKVSGAWWLHERTRDLSIDLFVCFSSVASVLGAQGRAHYAAANAFLDALALERRHLGLPVTTINWGPWTGGGMATSEQLEQFERIGNHGLEPDAALQMLDDAVAGGVSNAVVADIDWSRFLPVYEARRPRPVLSELAVASVPVGGPSDDTVTHPAPPPPDRTTSSQGTWIEQLEAQPAAQRVATLTTLLRREVAGTLGFDDPERVPLDRSFYEIGMDSLMMADFVSRLRARIGMSCTALVFDHPDLRSLPGALLAQLPLARPAVTAAAEPDTPRASVASSSAPAASSSGTFGYAPYAEPEIFAFQASEWPHRSLDLIPRRWRWMFVGSARRLGVEPRIWIHRDGGRIVGHMGSIPVRLRIGHEERATGWLVDTMVSRDHRQQALGSRLMVDAHEDQPFSLSLGQTREMREIQLRLGWKQVAPLRIAQLVVRPEHVLKGKLPAPAAWAAGLGLRASTAVRDLLGERPSFHVRPVERFGETHDRLWACASRDLTCAVVRDASYLNWKYVDQPGQAFLRLEIADASGEPVGISVWTFRDPDRAYRYRRALLVDLVAPLSDAARLQQIVKVSCDHAITMEADALLCHHINDRVTQALRSCGFHLRQPERFLLVDPGPLSGPALDRVLDPGSWFVTYGDSDIDRPW